MGFLKKIETIYVDNPESRKLALGWTGVLIQLILYHVVTAGPDGKSTTSPIVIVETPQSVGQSPLID